jgi:hypothetical protein
MRGSGMDAEVVAWALLVLGVLVMVVLAALLGRHVRRLARDDEREGPWGAWVRGRS